MNNSTTTDCKTIFKYILNRDDCQFINVYLGVAIISNRNDTNFIPIEVCSALINTNEFNIDTIHKYVLSCFALYMCESGNMLTVANLHKLNDIFMESILDENNDDTKNTIIAYLSGNDIDLLALTTDFDGDINELSTQ